MNVPFFTTIDSTVHAIKRVSTMVVARYRSFADPRLILKYLNSDDLEVWFVVVVQ